MALCATLHAAVLLAFLALALTARSRFRVFLALSLLCCYFLRSRVRFCILALISADSSITHATSSEQFKCTRSLACFFCAPRHFYSTPSLACLFLSCSSMADSVAGFDLNVRLEEPEDDDSVDEVHLDEPPLENESGKASVISFLLQTDLHLTTP